jgi:hypothetical protein
MNAHEMLATAVLLFSVVGTYLLYREVDIGHTVEELGAAFAEITDLMLLYRIDKHEFAVRYLEYSSLLNRDQASDAIDLAGEQHLEGLASDYHTALTAQSRAAIERWHEATVPTSRLLRRRLLRLGLVLLLLAAVTAFIAELSS